MPKKDFKIAAAYIRVSTDDQLELSPDAQLFELRKWAGKNGYLIPDEHVYVEEGISGKKSSNRPSFQRLIGTAKQNERPFDAILVWKFSRFARNQEESIVYKNMLRKQCRIDVISISEPVIDGPFGSLIERIIEWMDEYYSINLAQEVLRGMTEKARRGELQSTPAFGYRVENNKLVPEPEEAAFVQEIFSRFLSGHGMLPIARWLNDLGVRTHRGNRFENRTVDYILHNPVYIGKLRWNPAGRTRRDFGNENIILSDAGHEPLIDADTWDAAQERIAQLKAQWKYKGRPVSELKDWLSGLIRCSVCGATLLYQNPGYFKCGHYLKGRCTTSQHIRVDLLREALLSRMSKDLTSDVILSVTVTHAGDGAGDELDRQRQALEQVNKKTLRLNEAYLAGAYNVTELKEYKDAMEADAERILARITDLENESVSDDVSEQVRSALSDALKILNSPTASLAEKHDAAAAVIESCVWSKADSLLTIVYRLYL